MNSISHCHGPICEFFSLQNTLREYGGRDLVSSVSNVAFVHVSIDLYFHEILWLVSLEQLDVEFGLNQFGVIIISSCM